jgi:hypothetical protein
MNFFDFSSKLSSSTIQAHTIGLNKKDDSSGLQDQWRLIQGDYNKISFPVLFKQQYGKKIEDVLNTGWPGLYLVSDRFKAVLEDNNLTGWKTFPVNILDKKSQEIPGYHGLSFTGKSGPKDYSKSEIIEKKLVPNGPLCKYYKGFCVDLDKWDGSDFFLPGKSFGALITGRANEILKKNKLTNLRLENIADIETNEYTVQVYLEKM